MGTYIFWHYSKKEFHNIYEKMKKDRCVVLWLIPMTMKPNGDVHFLARICLVIETYQKRRRIRKAKGTCLFLKLGTVWGRVTFCAKSIEKI